MPRLAARRAGVLYDEALWSSKVQGTGKRRLFTSSDIRCLRALRPGLEVSITRFGESRAEFEGIGRNEENPDRPETIGVLSRHARLIHLVPAMRLGMAGSVAPVPTSCSNANTAIRGLSIRFDVVPQPEGRRRRLHYPEKLTFPAGRPPAGG
jgi:hypothetical protein